MERVVIDLLDQFERGKISRRQLVQNLTFGLVAAGVAGTAAAAQPSKGKSFKAIAVNHISFSVADYGRTRDFYADLLGMKVSEDNGKQCYLTFGDTVLLPRNAKDRSKAPLVDHISYSLDSWDRKEVEDELKRRGLDPKPDFNGSFHVRDPDGYDLQISSKTFMTETS